MFKEMKLGTKLYTGFGLLLIILVAVSFVAWQEFNHASEGFQHYRGLARDTNLAGRLQANMLMVRMNVKNFIITGSEKDKKQYSEYVEKMTGFLREAEKEIQHPERAAMVKKIAQDEADYTNGFAKVTGFQAERDKQVKGVLNIRGPEMERLLTKVMISAYKDQDAEAAYYAGAALRSLLLARLYVVKFLDDNSKASADRVDKEFADFKTGMEELKARIENPERKALINEVINREASYKDAFGKLSAAIWSRNDIITNTLDKIGPHIAMLAEDVKLSVKADQDTLGPELQASNQQAVVTIIIIAAVAILIGIILAVFITRSVTKPINGVISGLKTSSFEVNGASSQVSTSSQSLAEGASQQAASLEETTSSMEEMESMTKQNADNAQQADLLSQDSNNTVGKAAESMKDLRDAMERINSASDEMAKIVKNIDEIAFQTNLLALNAAVEAARAGEAGAGFAVVADEVRNLAMRAAEAAKSTSELIEENIKNIKDGTGLVVTTDEAFTEVREGAVKVAELVGEIAAASKEQTTGIGQVNQAMTEMDRVTQSSAANAEETAAASEQLNTQALAMDGYVNDLIKLVGGAAGQQYSANGQAKPGGNGAGRPASQKAAANGKQTDPEQMIPMGDDGEDFQNF